MTEETPTETPPVEEVKQERNEKGQFKPKEEVEPLYSKRNPENTDRKGSITSTMEDYRDLLLKEIDVELDEDFEKQSVRKQIQSLKDMVTYKTLTEKREEPDAPTEQPLDKTGKAQVGGEVPASTTTHIPSLLEKNRADIMIRQTRKKTGYTQYRKKWEQ